MASFRASHPECVTLADAVVALVPALQLTTRQTALVSFPGTPVPSEAWLTSGAASVGVFQQGATAYAVVWVAGKLRRLALPKRSALHALAGWLNEAVAAQLEQGAGAPVTPLPPGPEATLTDVLRALRSGSSLELGGGRYSTTYFVKDGQLQRTTFDEGETWTQPISEAELVQAFTSEKQAFQRELARKRRA